MSGKNKLFMISTIILILFSFISCSSKEERRIISQIQKNGFVDLSIYCKQFDKIVIYDEGYYYYDNNKDEINYEKYLLKAAEKENETAMFNLGGLYQKRGNTIFYLIQIEKYKTGKLLRLENQKKDIQILSFE